MKNVKNRMRAAIVDAVARAFETQIDPELVSIETPPDPTLGDLAFPMFPFARVLRTGPPQIAARIADALTEQDIAASAAGPYVNVRLARGQVAGDVLSSCLTQGGEYGHGSMLEGERVTVEFSSPNTNKPLHLGHLRNNALGTATVRLLRANGASVRAVNLVNDRGIHICKSMLAYQKFGNGETPESSGIKGDKLVGNYYVRFAEWAKTDDSAEDQAREMLRAWEAGDEAVVSLWREMNRWVLSGIQETYRTTGIEFDAIYYESQTYTSGKDEIKRGLEAGVFARDDDGSVWIDLESINLDRKILLRSDGTSVYVTQDIGTVIARYNDSPFDRMIYVVGSEQNYHFRVLFHVLETLGYEWAPQLHHLSYGMVNLPEGKMKSREGTVVDADDLIAELQSIALKEIETKEREGTIDNKEDTALAIAVGALHYFLLQVSPAKDMIFDPRESLSFTGDTGPYLQYTGARISSLLRKAERQGLDNDAFSLDSLAQNALGLDAEWALVRAIGSFPEIVEQAGRELAPSLLVSFLYDLARKFSGYYHEVQVLAAPDEGIRRARVALVAAVRQVLMNGMELLNIPFLNVM